jgi:NAD(P)-dependent dehydrogenase (short-subunit alcohol dehydrogenase family)
MAKPGELKTALITGGTDGLGKATAILLAEAGFRVVATGRNSARRAALETLARGRKLPLTTVEMDVREDASVERALAEARSQVGPLEVLINNAGVGYYAVMEEISMEDLRQQFETNFFGAVRVTQRVLPELRARRCGRIINVSSIAGKYAFPLFGPYSASKHALEAASDALRMELRPLGIDVVLIEPGYIPTGFQGRAQELASEYIQNAERSPYVQLYKNYGRSYRKTTASVKDTPEDCARVILRALRAERPRARYTVTRRAAVLSFAKRLLPDAFLDWRIGSSLGWRNSRLPD